MSSRSALRDQRDLHVTLRKTLPKHSNSLLYHTKTSKQVSFIFNINIIFSLSQKVKAMWAIFDSLVYANYWFMLLQRPYSQLRPFIPMFWQSLKKFQFFLFSTTLLDFYRRPLLLFYFRVVYFRVPPS